MLCFVCTDTCENSLNIFLESNGTGFLESGHCPSSDAARDSFLQVAAFHMDCSLETAVVRLCGFYEMFPQIVQNCLSAEYPPEMLQRAQIATNALSGKLVAHLLI